MKATAEKSLRIPITRPTMGEEEIQALASVVESGWLTQGARVREFEEAFAATVGVKHAIASSSATTALHVALLLNKIGPGDEVIVPSYTWIATANVVRMVGAVPIFADIELDTYNVSRRTIEPLITPRTKAIMPVHQFGTPVDLDPIAELARRHGLLLIEDAACAVGSRYKGKPIGSHGNIACFSFHPRKVITTGEGGMLVTDDDELARCARVLMNHGASLSDQAKHASNTVESFLSEEFTEIGYNYRMTNLQGAVGTIQMKRLTQLLAGRRELAERYAKAFAEIPQILAPQTPSYATPNWQSYAVRIREDCPISRNAIAQTLLDAGVSCRPAYMACHLQPVYRAQYPNLRLPNTQTALDSVILLPIFPQLTKEEQAYTIDLVTTHVPPLPLLTKAGEKLLPKET